MKHGVLNINAAGLVQSANVAAAEFFSHRVPDLVGREWSVILDSIEIVEREELIRAVGAAQAGAWQEMIGRCVARDAAGLKRELTWSASRLADAGVEHRVALSFFLGVGEGTASTAALDRYRDIVEHAVEGIFRTTVDGHYLEANPALARMYGFATPGELVATLSDLNRQLYVKPGRRAEFVEAMKREGCVSDFESEVYRSDGSTIWIAEFARTVLDGSGNPLYFEGSVIDVTAHHWAEVALRESEEKYRLLLESMNVLPWEADLESGLFTYVGPQAVRYLGFPLEEWFRPGFWRDHVHPEDRDWVSIAREEALDKGEGFESEYRMIRATGEVIWIRDLMNIISASAGQRILGGFMVDVTFRRFNEASLREGQHFFEQLASSAPVILYVYDLPNSQCRYINGGVTELIGYSKQALREMRPLFFHALAHPDELAGHLEHLSRLSRSSTGEVVVREFRLRGSGGTWVWLRSREKIFRRGSDGEPQQIVGTATDITVQRLALEELANSEELFRSLAETTKVLPFEVNLHSARITYVGPQAESLLGYPSRHWYTEGFWVSIVHPDDRQLAIWPTQEHPDKLETDFQAEVRLKTKTGGYLWVRQVVRLVAGDHPQKVARGFLVDITDSKVREEEQRQSRQQLRDLALRNQSIREEERISIARELHDELGQVLTLFRIDLEWLEAHLGKLTRNQERTTIMRKVVEMKGMTNSTLESLRRILTNLRPPVLDELGLQAAIEWQAEEFSRRVGIRCEVNTEDCVCGNKDIATAIFRIFQELLTNVAKHARASGVRVTLVSNDSHAKLVVSDNGCGMPPKEADQGKQSFGLLGIRERAAALGGHCEISSAPGGGTLVAVEIPL